MEGQADALWATMHQCARTKMIRDAAEPGPRRAPEPWGFSHGRSARGAGKILDAGGAEARPREPSAHAHDRMTHGARASPPQHQGVKSHLHVINVI